MLAVMPMNYTFFNGIVDGSKFYVLKYSVFFLLLVAKFSFAQTNLGIGYVGPANFIALHLGISGCVSDASSNGRLSGRKAFL